MEEIKTKLIQLGDKNNISGLQDYIATIDLKDLTSFLNDNLCNQEGGKIWKYLLQSFDDTPVSHKKRYEICMSAVKLIEENDLTDSVANEIILLLRDQLSKFKPNHLIDICNFCTKKIQEGNILQRSWKELMPEILSILGEKSFVWHNNVEISGLEFKSQTINSLCSINWSPNIATLLASMFRDISLTKEEHLQIVLKLSLCMESLTCQELPAFTYQLLKLCSTHNSRIIFLRLQHYFSHRIYKNLGKDLVPNSDSTDFDDITDASEYDAAQVESTILYYIHESAASGNDCIKEYINSLKNMTKAPEYILHPFQLTVLLTISSVSIFEEQTLDIIRSCIVRVITEDVKKNDTAWFRNIISSSSKTSNIISAILENSIKERPYVAQGLINLSFVLLGAGAALGMKNIAEAQWQLGTFILLKLMKKMEEVSNSVINQLCNRIVVGENVPHLTECLHQMCRNLTLTMLEHQGIVIHLTEQTLQLPGWSSKFIVDAIMPLIKVSYKIRDNFILLLRKALFSRELEIRKMAVSGYLKLLKCLRIGNLNALSQANSSTSNFSFLTQVSLDNHVQRSVNQFSNEAICLEVLGILRRCFMQQAEVREVLYDGLYDAVCMNAELSMPVLKMLSNHFIQFYTHEEETLPPLDFSKIVVKKNNEVFLQEPLGHLIYVIGLILTKVKDSHDHEDPSIIRITNIMDSLCDRMAKCELINFNLDTGRDLLDDLPECQTDLHVLKQAMSVYEALMGYLISAWNATSENLAQKLHNLFTAYNRLVDLSKNINKPKKAEGKKKSKDDNKNKTTPTAKHKIFKPVPTVLDFQTIGKILNILHEPTISSVNSSESNILKVKFEFHRYVLNAILQLIQHLKTSKCIETIHTKPYFNYCTEISKVLYERIIKRLSYVVDFDIQTAVLGVECFHAILNLIVTYYKEKLVNFLAIVGTKNKDNDLGDHILPFIEILQNFFEKDEDEYSTDAEGKKIPVLLVNIYTILISNIPHHGPQAIQILGWLKKFINENTVSNKHVGNALISVSLSLNIRCKEESGLYENIAVKLCKVIGTIELDELECPVQLLIINEATALPALGSLANTLKLMLNEAEWIIQRCKAEYCMIIHPGVDKIERRKEILKSEERDLCCHICRIVKVCTIMSNMAVPPGPNAETVFKLLMQLFNTLNSITKYFLLISSKINPAFQSARFEQVLKLSGKPLSRKVYSFISYIDHDPEEDEESTQNKKKSLNLNTMKTKILRETRLIPKLVYEMELFGRNVITLSNKTKIDLSKYVGLGTSRDFRIQAQPLKEALEEQHDNLDDSRTTIIEGEEITQILQRQVTEEDTGMEVEEEEEITQILQRQDTDEDTSMEVEEVTNPPQKKARKSK